MILRGVWKGENSVQSSVADLEKIPLPYPSELYAQQGRAAIIPAAKIYDSYSKAAFDWFAGAALIDPNAKFAITRE